MTRVMTGILTEAAMTPDGAVWDVRWESEHVGEWDLEVREVREGEPGAWTWIHGVEADFSASMTSIENAVHDAIEDEIQAIEEARGLGIANRVRFR